MLKQQNYINKNYKKKSCSNNIKYKNKIFIINITIIIGIFLKIKISLF